MFKVQGPQWFSTQPWRVDWATLCGLHPKK